MAVASIASADVEPIPTESVHVRPKGVRDGDGDGIASSGSGNGLAHGAPELTDMGMSEGYHGGERTVEELVGKKKGLFSYVKTRDFWVVLALGQVLALCLTGTNTFSALLAGKGTSIPAFQTFFNYVLLNIVYTSYTIYRYGFKKWTKIILKDGWRYFILAFLDVEGNYFVVLAYRYTTILSAQLINFWAIVVVIILSLLFLHVRYHLTQYAGILVCCGGMGLLLASDHITGANGGPAANPLKGDLFALLGATFYGFSNCFEEFLVSKRPMYEWIIHGFIEHVFGYEKFQLPGPPDEHTSNFFQTATTTTKTIFRAREHFVRKEPSRKSRHVTSKTLENQPSLISSSGQGVEMRSSGTSYPQQDVFKYLHKSSTHVEGNYFVVLAYRYTTILSAQLINFWAIVVVIILSLLFLHVRYHLTQYAGIMVCCGGMGLLLASDHITGANGGPAANPLKGDLFALLGATFYGFSNCFEEFLVSKRPMYEVVGQLAFWGMLINGTQTGIFDRASFRGAVWDGDVGGYLVGYTLLLFIFYSLAPLLFRLASAAFFNISLLTGNFWGVIVGVQLFHLGVHWMYPVAFVLILLGLFVYFMTESVLGEAKKPWLGENQEGGVSGLGTAKRRAERPGAIV
ncbi:hypothetical protein B0A49_01011 [Cryomyces minteri]|uniref:Uncharacterized protein n=1 Tax=Cryomyces minteri TaxID=331657 RepID=A0A4U0XPL0_9PEZI|nr:hypothetical protein B0A49_01011 [Cryomyces minteri]